MDVTLGVLLLLEEELRLAARKAPVPWIHEFFYGEAFGVRLTLRVDLVGASDV